MTVGRAKISAAGSTAKRFDFNRITRERRGTRFTDDKDTITVDGSYIVLFFK